MLIRRIKNEKGFTLLEVIIVVVIIAILAAAVIPRFSITRDEAEKSACAANRHMIRTQVELFRFKEGRIPSWGSPDNFGGDTDYFPHGWPQCPSDNDGDQTDYSIDINTGAVTCTLGVGH